MKKKIALVSALFVMMFILCITSCSRNIATEPDKNISKKKSTYDFDPIYQKEGFIEKNIFRVVIVTIKSQKDTDMDSIKDTAKKRSLSTLQKYLQENNKIINQNTTAQLLNLIEFNGSLKQKENISENHNIYYFDIEKQDVKRYVESVSQK